MAEIDLDCVAREPVKIRFKGDEYILNDPTTEQLIRHDRLLIEFDELREEAESLVREDDPDKQDLIQQKMEEFRHENRYFHQKIFSIFVPGLEKHYEQMTLSQREKVLALIFGETTQDEKKIPDEEESPGEK